jgi:hypothetical protein
MGPAPVIFEQLHRLPVQPKERGDWKLMNAPVVLLARRVVLIVARKKHPMLRFAYHDLQSAVVPEIVKASR